MRFDSRARRRSGIGIAIGALPVILGVAGCKNGLEPRVVNEEFATRIEDMRSHYRLRPGDHVNIRFPTKEGIDEEDLLVANDGGLSVRILAGRTVKVAGMPVDEVAEIVRKTQKEYTEGDLPVVVQLRQAVVEKVWVSGEVRVPRPVDYVPGMTALDAIFEAGGNLPSGKMRNIILIRPGEGNQYFVRRVDIKHNLDQGLPLFPRDCIYVPRTIVANVATFIREYITNLLPIPGGVPTSALLAI
ncbi:MAG: SLBB domain-containing protein [Planctomycetes bacterium]|nr:SLBB domain-containing protein [Planctomycetota bacterium]